MADEPSCFHRERIGTRNGRDVWRACPETPVDTFEGYPFCALHLPPGPKAA